MKKKQKRTVASDTNVRFYASGGLSLRVNGEWQNSVAQIARDQYLALDYDDKERIVLREYETGKSLVENTAVLIKKEPRPLDGCLPADRISGPEILEMPEFA